MISLYGVRDNQKSNVILSLLVPRKYKEVILDVYLETPSRSLEELWKGVPIVDMYHPKDMQ